jgi:4-aminobutyrate aminotransferase-like enzyme
MMLMPTGLRETIRFVPALVITEKEVDECLEILEDAMKEVMG